METIKLPGLKPIPINEILYLCGRNNYTLVIKIDGQPEITSITLGYAEKWVPGFIRIHKKFLINPTYIQSIERPTYSSVGSMTLKGSVNLAISRRRWAEIQFVLSKRHE